MPDRHSPIGGQAVIEGVMMRSPGKVATAVRLPDGTIQVKTQEFVSISRRAKIFGLPIVRGAVVLIESLRIGVQALAFSAEAAVQTPQEAPKAGKRFGPLGLGMGFTVAISFLLDGGFRLLFFMTYILGVGYWGEMQRVFMYHGAEHKTNHNLESGKELSPETAQSFSRFHPRCGTSFLFLVMIVSILVFAFLGRPDTWQARLLRFSLIPVIAGISFEIIRFAGAHYDKKWVRWMSEPGLNLQRLTTREPSSDMLEVAIAALRAVL